MSVRRVGAVAGISLGLALLGGPAWADQTPSPEPVGQGIDDSGMVTEPYCYEEPVGEEPSGDGTVTAEPDPGDGGTVDPTEEPPVEATTDPTDEPPVDPTEEPSPDPGTTIDPSEEPAPTADPDPTGDPEPTIVPEPTGAPEPTGGTRTVCVVATDAQAGEGDPTLGEGTANTSQLAFSGAPVTMLAVTGLALVGAGSLVVVVARRRTPGRAGKGA
ncbi:MAG: hypothetical protein M3P04_05195 [Actinomycetota bacterium]|nr:hypothetical protein [Actinomycetota bacterium]